MQQADYPLPTTFLVNPQPAAAASAAEDLENIMILC